MSTVKRVGKPDSERFEGLSSGNRNRIHVRPVKSQISKYSSVVERVPAPYTSYRACDNSCGRIKNGLSGHTVIRLYPPRPLSRTLAARTQTHTHPHPELKIKSTRKKYRFFFIGFFSRTIYRFGSSHFGHTGKGPFCN